MDTTGSTCSEEDNEMCGDMICNTISIFESIADVDTDSEAIAFDAYTLAAEQTLS